VVFLGWATPPFLYPKEARVVRAPGPLAPFQEITVQRMVTKARHMPLLRMGLGKTVVTVVAAWRVRKDIDRIYIFCRENGIKGWVEHFQKWFAYLAKEDNTQAPKLHFHIADKADPYHRHHRWQFKFPKDGVIRIFIMTHQMAVIDSEVLRASPGPQMIIVDEAKRIWGHTSKAFKVIKYLATRPTVKYVYPMTGSRPRHPGQAWTMFHLCRPSLFPSYWKFVETFSYTQEGLFGGREILGLKNEDNWRMWLAQNATIVNKEDVADQMPPKNRELVPVRMDKCQERIYKDFDQQLMAILPESDRILIAKNSLEKTIRFRQLFICPKILDPNLTWGTALEDIGDQIAEADDEEPQVIFTPYKKAQPWIEQYLRTRVNRRIFHLHGGITADQLEQIIAEWRKTRGIITCTILYATSFDLQPATNAYFLGYEWDPEDNDQALDRLHRWDNPDIKVPVNGYFYTYEGTEDEKMAETVIEKHQMIQTTMDLGALRTNFRP
jgi:SNF2 family DNA or RNA helicase